MLKSKLLYGLTAFFATFVSSIYLIPKQQIIIPQAPVTVDRVESRQVTEGKRFELHFSCEKLSSKPDDAYCKCVVAGMAKIIESAPANVENYQERGIWYSRLGDYEKAIEDFSKAIELDPSNTSYYDSRGDNYAKQKNYELAMADYGRSIELDPESIGGYKGRARIYHEIGFYPKAIADYTKAIKIYESVDHAGYEIYYERANSYYKNGYYLLALKDYTKAIEMNEEESEYNKERAESKYYKERAEVYLKLGQKKNAEADRKKYEELSKEQ